MTGKNDESHTFKIQHTSTGHEKVVHHNLIMPVNSLPLPDDESNDEVDASSLPSSLSNGQEAATNVSVGSAEYRTRMSVSVFVIRLPVQHRWKIFNLEMLWLTASRMLLQSVLLPSLTVSLSVACHFAARH